METTSKSFKEEMILTKETKGTNVYSGSGVRTVYIEKHLVTGCKRIRVTVELLNGGTDESL